MKNILHVKGILQIWLRTFEMRKLSWMFRVIPKSYYKCPFKRESEGNYNRQKMCMWPQKQIGMMQHKSKNAGSREKLEQARISWREYNLDFSFDFNWFWTSGLQNCERINLYCFKPLNLRLFVKGVSGNIVTVTFSFSFRSQSDNEYLL